MVETRYQNLLVAERPLVSSPGAAVELISGSYGGAAGPALTHWPISGAIVTVDPGQTLAYPIPARDRAFVYLLAGTLRVAGRLVTEGQVAWSDPLPPTAVGSTLSITAPERDVPAVAMIYSGEPIGQHVQMGGPFVMNTAAEIDQAFLDFHSGGFGDIPRQARLTHR